MNAQNVVTLKKPSTELNMAQLSDLIDEISMISNLLALAASNHPPVKMIQFAGDSITSKCEGIKKMLS